MTKREDEKNPTSAGELSVSEFVKRLCEKNYHFFLRNRCRELTAEKASRILGVHEDGSCYMPDICQDMRTGEKRVVLDRVPGSEEEGQRYRKRRYRY